MTVVPDVTTERAAPKRKGRVSRLSRADKVVLVVMCGVPSLLLIAFVWFPALASVGLSFTSWDGIGGIGTIKWVGVQNYDQIFSIYPPFWPAFRHNLIWLAFLALLPTTFGIFLAVLLDKQIRFSRIYQSALYLPVMLEPRAGRLHRPALLLAGPGLHQLGARARPAPARTGSATRS